jgi:hypothetical protein
MPRLPLRSQPEAHYGPPRPLDKLTNRFHSPQIELGVVTPRNHNQLRPTQRINQRLIVIQTKWVGSPKKHRGRSAPKRKQVHDLKPPKPFTPSKPNTPPNRRIILLSISCRRIQHHKQTRRFTPELTSQQISKSTALRKPSDIARRSGDGRTNNRETLHQTDYNEFAVAGDETGTLSEKNILNLFQNLSRPTAACPQIERNTRFSTTTSQQHPAPQLDRYAQPVTIPPIRQIVHLPSCKHGVTA